MNTCRNGVTRLVILVGPLAIKLPRFGYGYAMGLRGLLCNMQERAVWTLGWPQLCPVLFATWGGWLTVMRRARPLTDEEWASCTVEWIEGFRHHRKASIGDKRMVEGIVPVEYKRDSFGVVDGRIVAVDYGS
jgi:hypothetical protein